MAINLHKILSLRGMNMIIDMSITLVVEQLS